MIACERRPGSKIGYSENSSITKKRPLHQKATKQEIENENIAALLFEANILKNIPRSGYHFLGASKESVAEHSFCATFIAYVMAMMEPEADSLRLISMCLVHDRSEARTGDHN
ncbi:MAG: HD domain-containing protein [Desulfobacterales bacterium]